MVIARGPSALSCGGVTARLACAARISKHRVADQR